jgi:tetratricopeptide (TPR) repeat protein
MDNNQIALERILRDLQHDREWAGYGSQDAMQLLLDRVDRGMPIRVEGAFDDRPLTRAQIYRAFGFYHEALDAWEVEIAQASAENDIAELIYLLGIAGTYYLKTGNIPTGEAYLREGLVLAQESGKPDDIAQIHIELCYLAIAREDYAAAMEHSRQVEYMGRAGNNPRYIALGLGNQGSVYAQSAEYEQAMALFQQAINIAIGSRDTLMQAGFWRNAGMIYLKMTRPYEAIDALERVQAIYAQMNIPPDPQLTELIGKIKAIVKKP